MYYWFRAFCTQNLNKLKHTTTYYTDILGEDHDIVNWNKYKINRQVAEVKKQNKTHTHTQMIFPSRPTFVVEYS